MGFENGVSRLSRRAILGGAAMAFLPREAQAQNISSGFSLRDGVVELERTAEQEAYEGFAVRIALSSGVSDFGDIRLEPDIIQMSAGISTPPQAVASIIDRVYDSFSEAERRRALIRATFFHTHPTTTMRDMANLISPVFVDVVNRNLPLTMPPSIVDVRGFYDGGFWSAIRTLTHVPHDRVRLQGVVVDESMTYAYRALTRQERRRERLPEFQDHFAGSFMPGITNYMSLSFAASFVLSLPENVRGRYRSFESPIGLFNAAVMYNPAYDELALQIAVSGDMALSDRLLEDRDEIRNYRSVVRFEEIRSAWAQHVGESLQAGTSWADILEGREYADLQSFFGRYYNTNLIAIPNADVHDRLPRVLETL